MEHFDTSNKGRTEPVWQDPANPAAAPESFTVDAAVDADAAPAAVEPWHARGNRSRWTSRAAYAGAGVAALVMIAAVAATMHSERQVDQALALVAKSARVDTPSVASVVAARAPARAPAGAPAPAQAAVDAPPVNMVPADPEEVLPPMVMLPPESKPAPKLAEAAPKPVTAPKLAATQAKPVTAPKLAATAPKLATTPKPAAVQKSASAAKLATAPKPASAAKLAATAPKRAAPRQQAPSKARAVTTNLPKATASVKKDKPPAHAVAAKASAVAHKGSVAVAPSSAKAAPAKTAAPVRTAESGCRPGQLARECN